MPSLFQAVRLVVPYSLVLAIALEMMQVGIQGSAGRLLFMSQANSVSLDTSSFIVIISLGFISFALSKMLNRLDAFANERSFR